MRPAWRACACRTYQTCNEFGFYQTCDPGTQCPFTSEPHLNSLRANTELCDIAFGIPPRKITTNIIRTNNFYGRASCGR